MTNRGVNPGEVIDYQVTINNGGALIAGTLDIDMRASADTTYVPANDPSTGIQTVTIGRQATQVVNISGVLPQLAPGQYYAVADADPSNTTTEIDDANNTGVSAATFDSGPDFAIGAITAPRGISPGATGAFVVRIDNLAVGSVGNVEYQLFASADDTLRQHGHGPRHLRGDFRPRTILDRRPKHRVPDEPARGRLLHLRGGRSERPRGRSR